MERTNWLCEHCQAKGVTTEAKVVDHVVPLAKGGPDTDTNTQNLCIPCHDLKTRADFEQKAPKRKIGLDGWPED